MVTRQASREHHLVRELPHGKGQALTAAGERLLTAWAPGSRISWEDARDRLAGALLAEVWLQTAVCDQSDFWQVTIYRGLASRILRDAVRRGVLVAEETRGAEDRVDRSPWGRLHAALRRPGGGRTKLVLRRAEPLPTRLETEILAILQAPGVQFFG